MLAVVTSLARQTKTAGCSAEEYRDALLGRLQTLVRASNFGFDADAAVELAELVHATLEPYTVGSDRVELEDAPNVLLAADKVVPVSLILHELATNALKYGALSTPAGRLRIGWSVDGNAEGLRVFWRESGGSATSSPETPGFGTRLIDFATKRDLGGEMERTFGPDGLSVEIRFPL
jgi:two-component sensor histidine kinase